MKKSARINTGVIGSLPYMKGAVAMSTIDMNTTLGEGCEKWLYQFKKNSVKIGTFTRLQTSMILMKKYPIAVVPLYQLNTDCIQRYVNQLVADGYALTTIKKQYNLITSYMRYLIGDGAPINPAYMNVKLPTEDVVVKHKKEVVAYNKIEQKRLSEACEVDNDLGAWVVTLLIETGMRIGELLALSWSDVIWEKQAVWIKKTLVNHNSRKTTILQNSAKSKSSQRRIPLSDKAMRLLEYLLDKAKNTDGLIFSLSDDQPNLSIGYCTCRTNVTKLCREANVRYLGFHVFRHTFATNCYYRGCDVKKLSKLLGHSDVSITYNTYIHLFGDDLEDLRSVVN